MNFSGKPGKFRTTECFYILFGTFVFLKLCVHANADREMVGKGAQAVQCLHCYYLQFQLVRNKITGKLHMLYAGCGN